MIQVNVLCHHSLIQSITISGHANFAVTGKDLVCAATSAIAFGLGNALDEMSKQTTVIIEKNEALFQVNDTDETTQVILKTALIQLETLAEVNHSFIKINKMEV